MKASIKFREDQKPVLRAKVPLNILSLPFQSGIVAGEAKELSLNLSTFFDAGPAFKIAYRPNDSQNPFSFICKTGIGHFGSPISSPFTMSAEFNFVGNQNPTFFIHFKPKLGDFSIKKSHSSSLVKKIESKTNGKVSAEETSVVKIGYFEESGLFPGAGKIGVLPAESAAAAAAATGMIDSVFSGMEVNAKTSLPLKSRAVANFRWGLRFPPSVAADVAEDAVAVGRNEKTAGISFKKFPILLMDKISIEHVAKDNSKDSKGGSGRNLARSGDVAEACLDVKKQLEVIQAENGLLRKALTDLSSEIAAGKMNLTLSGGGGGAHAGRYKEGERNANQYSGSGRADKKSSEVKGKTVEEDVSEELKKALKGATAA